MRILLICDWFLKYVADLGIALARESHDVSLLCRRHAMEFGHDQDERSALLERIRSVGIDVHEVPGRPSSVRAARPAFEAIAAARRARPEIVHVQEAVYDPRFFAAAGLQPLVLTLHDPEPHFGARLNAKQRLLQELWRRRAQKLVVHSTHLIPQLGRYSDRAAVVPHGTDLRPHPNDVPASPRILFFGRLERYKGIRVLLEAMETVWGRRPDVRLTIAGVGAEGASIPDDSRIDAQIGYLPEERLDEVFATASLVALPYLDASQSGVGLLALARGIPVVVTDVGGLPELALDSTYVVPPGDAASLADAILKHVGDGPDVRRQVLDRATVAFGWGAIAKTTIGVYEEVLMHSNRNHTPGNS